MRHLQQGFLDGILAYLLGFVVTTISVIRCNDMKSYKPFGISFIGPFLRWTQQRLSSLLLITMTLLFISYLHYSTAPGISQLHAVYRYFYFLPIVYGALQFGYWGGLLTALATTLLFVPHILLRWDIQTLDAFNDMLVVFVFFGVALITGLTIDRLRCVQSAQAETARQLTLSLEQLQIQGDELRRAERLNSLGTLAGGLAHEIRNPVGIIRASAQLLELEGDESAAETVHVIRQETSRIEQLIQELLTYAGDDGPKRMPTDLYALIQQSCKRLQPIVETSNIQLRVDVPPTEVTVDVDASQIEKALINLCMNAIQAFNGSGVITVMARPIGSPPIKIQVIVADNGPGISPADLSRIFDPFFSTKESGTGLGLSVVQRIVEDHEGSIHVISQEGYGTTFTLGLPVGSPK